MKTSTIVIGAAAIGGYYWWQEQKKKAIVKDIAAAPGQASSFFSDVAKGITGAISSILAPVVTLGQPTTQNVNPPTGYDPDASEAAFDQSQLGGYYGTLGGTGKTGSLGGGLRALRGGKYGSLG